MTPSKPAEDFVILEALLAEKPFAVYADKLMLFGQFVGKWVMDIKFYGEAGNTIYHQPGQWAFSWVLDGRAIQDVLTNPGFNSCGTIIPGERRRGTTLRAYNPKLDIWQAVWMAPASGFFIAVTGKPDGDKILLEGSEAPGILNRWQFSEIAPDSFHWEGIFPPTTGLTGGWNRKCGASASDKRKELKNYMNCNLLAS